MWKAVKDRRILLLFFLFSSIQSFSQNETILINFKASSTTIGSVIEAVHEQTKSSFIYKASDVDPERNVHLSSSAISLNDLLKEAFPKNEFNIKLRRNSIILKKQKSAASEAVLKNDFSVKGYVADAKTGEALIGATVIIANTYKGTASNKYGFYSIALSGNEHELIVSSIGYETKKIVVSEMTNQTVDIQKELPILM